MKKAESILDWVASQTDTVLLMHSASGKDSIALCEMCAKRFNTVYCVYEYIVKGLEHQARYINYASQRYPNVRWVQTPHYAVYSFIKHGYMGCRQNKGQKLVKFGEIIDIMRERLGIEWAVVGFKQSDGLNRRLMLRSYREEAINDEKKIVYPLSTYTNTQVLDYIKREGLVRPEKYKVNPSSSVEVADPSYLKWLRDNFPEDLKKVYAAYPMAERIIFEQEYNERTSAERDKGNQEESD